MLFVLPVCVFNDVLCIVYSGVYYLNVSFNGLITSVREDRAVFLQSITRNFVVSVRRCVCGGGSSWFLE